MKSNLQIAQEIEDKDTSKGHRIEAVALYTGYISGEKFVRTSRWWSEYKSIIEKRKVKTNLVSYRVNFLNWPEDEATGAKTGESRQQYRHRVGKIQKSCDDEKRINDLMNQFIYGEAIQCTQDAR